MKLYFVAKTQSSGFIGQLSIEEIVARLNANEITGSYVATESNGPSYSELVKRTDVLWEPVSKLAARTPLPEPGPGPGPGTPQALEERMFSSVGTRYRDAYLVARAVATIGAAVKFIGIGLGVLIVFAAVFIGSQSRSGDQFFVGGVLLGVIVAIPIYVLGVLVSAQAQVLKATLDAAVHTSPFLKKEDMARVMSL